MGLEYIVYTLSPGHPNAMYILYTVFKNVIYMEYHGVSWIDALCPALTPVTPVTGLLGRLPMLPRNKPSELQESKTVLKMLFKGHHVQELPSLWWCQI